MDRKKQYSTAASAKELPVWLVATFLLLHCEESAHLRNLSSADDRRVSPNTTTLDFNFLLQQKHSSLSPRTRLQAGSWQQDHLHCTSFLLRHLRKVLLLTAVPHNDEAARACVHLAQTPPSTAEPPTKNKLYSLDWLDQMHKEEHGSVGTSVRLTVEDLEKLHFLLQPPSGGGVDDPPMDIGSYVWGALYPGNPMPNNLTLPLGEVERIICRHLREEIVRHKGYGGDEGGPESTPPSSTEAQLAKLTLEDEDEGGASTQSQQQGYQKELTYTNLRGTTIMLKPENNTEYLRLHDLVISECSDAHFYLLQPFEHVTIAACTGCTVVVGAVAGLLHVVDCEKTQVTSAARRLLASNSADVLSYVFTPSPPLLVGDTRNCQLAPHNTYYEGLREDLLATGLAAAVSTSGTDQPSGNGSVSMLTLDTQKYHHCGLLHCNDLVTTTAVPKVLRKRKEACIDVVMIADVTRVPSAALRRVCHHGGHGKRVCPLLRKSRMLLTWRHHSIRAKGSEEASHCFCCQPEDLQTVLCVGMLRRRRMPMQRTRTPPQPIVANRGCL